LILGKLLVNAGDISHAESFFEHVAIRRKWRVSTEENRGIHESYTIETLKENVQDGCASHEKKWKTNRGGSTVNSKRT
jgi:hypothetical protein